MSSKGACAGRLQDAYSTQRTSQYLKSCWRNGLLVFSKKLIPLRTMAVILTAVIGTVTVSASVLPFLTGALGQKPTGNFLLTTTPSSLSMTQGASAKSTVALMSVNGFKGTVALYTDSVGGYFSAVFANRTVTLTVNGTSTTTLTLTAPNNAAGAYTIIVTGTASVQKKIISSSTAMPVTVSSNSDFGLWASPSNITENAGSTVTVAIDVDSLNGFSGNVSLAATTPFGFIAVMGGRNPITLASGGTVSTTLQISTMTNTPLGTYGITVTGRSTQHAHTIAVPTTITDPIVESLVLQRVSLSSPTNLTLFLKNTGIGQVTLQTYSVTDKFGDIWALHSWAGPSIAPNTVTAGDILIGSSCGACTYTGILFGFQQFSQGQTYTVTVTTAAGNRFDFTVTA